MPAARGVRDDLRPAFDSGAALAALVFATKNSSRPTLHRVFKVLYLAEKKHLERYGEPILGDRYIAMKKGPVPSRLYDLTKYLRGDGEYFTLDPDWKQLAEQSLEVRGMYIRAKSDPDMDELSVGAVRCLTEAIKELGPLDHEELTKWSHDSAWEATPKNGQMSWVDIVETLPNGKDVMDHLRDPFPGE